MSVSDRAVIVRSKETEIINGGVIGNHPEFPSDRKEKKKTTAPLAVNWRTVHLICWGRGFIIILSIR